MKLASDVTDWEIQWLTDRIHVGTSDVKVVKLFVLRARKAGFAKEERKKLYARALKAHHNNQKLYQQVMSGRFN